MEQIKNDKLTVCMSSFGAELQNIRDVNGQEYLWDGDKDYWNRHSPILFPIVCGLWKDTYRLDDKIYHLTRHGFARDSKFTVIRKSDSSITYGLHENEETLKAYPFHFNLAVTYRLDGNHIHVIWHVENTDIQTIYFQIGGHPAFRVPGAKKGEPLKGTLKVDKTRLERLFGNIGGCITKSRHPMKTDHGLMHFTEDDFVDDALIFDHSQLQHIELLDESGKAVITLDTKAPALGIWSPAGKHASFICIEPWYGIHDEVSYEGDFRKKDLMNQLLPGSSFMSEYIITVGS
ncbi:MAG: aldose 1-epimerase family protein [Prevotella sp.]|jgi:galactose mutarotase-like enzyme|nr:aldose 1-epimerase family protein [Prevotella sp.]MCH4182370.1 aldose 1-epimerase family protein [Prevotella sp.]MCH4212471.1 aldose 1-epimerase family protein [Prevotella sp.]MCH4240702.1 aldose 1-epimerase family protein [Prevotella sp.]